MANQAVHDIQTSQHFLSCLTAKAHYQPSVCERSDPDALTVLLGQAAVPPTDPWLKVLGGQNIQDGYVGLSVQHTHPCIRVLLRLQPQLLEQGESIIHPTLHAAMNHLVGETLTTSDPAGC